MTEANEKLEKHKKDINAKIEKLMAMDDHKLVCRATQSDMKLHISGEVTASRNFLTKALAENRTAMEKLIKELRLDMKHNGHLK